ncbi:MAG TPA: putative toxin-antitoxin system toxin component, PIN family [Blastocatellia bacterium]|nr:putative toxin-antitoxin system toxin component, PIN family [Blastocatellia bacterium]
MSKSRPGVVLDAMVFLQALVNEAGPAARLLDLVEDKKITLFVSQDTLNEARDLLSRSELRRRFPNLTDVRVEALFRRLSRMASLIHPVPRIFEYPRDPQDEPYINLAVEARADYLASRDRDLLDLMIGHSNDCKEFRRRFRPLKVVDPAALLQLLAKKNL